MKRSHRVWQTSISVFLAIGMVSCSSTPKSGQHLTGKARAELLLNLAGADLTENDPTGALISLNEAKEIDDSLPEEYYLFALAYYQKHETKLAIESARKAIQLKPDFSSAKNTLGKILLDQGKYAEAQKYLLEAASDLTARDAFIPKTNLGILYYQKMNFPEATHWLSLAIEDGKDAACMAYYYRGRIHLQQNELEDARRDLIKGSRNACSKFTDAHIAYGQTLIRMKKYQEARAKLLEIQQLFPDTDAATKATAYLRDLP